uniref:Uncharacterized protein n=1 Tax=Arundo donax TaxID=35708 RepID=A0A0A8YYF1_ARUDO
MQLLRCITRTSRRRKCSSSSSSTMHGRPHRRPAVLRRPCLSCLGCMSVSGLPCSSAEFELCSGCGGSIQCLDIHLGAVWICCGRKCHL